MLIKLGFFMCNINTQNIEPDCIWCESREFTSVNLCQMSSSLFFFFFKFSQLFLEFFLLSHLVPIKGHLMKLQDLAGSLLSYVGFLFFVCLEKFKKD